MRFFQHPQSFPRSIRFRPLSIIAVVAISISAMGGCRQSSVRSCFSPVVSDGRTMTVYRAEVKNTAICAEDLFLKARRLEAGLCPTCVDYYYRATLQSGNSWAAMRVRGDNDPAVCAVRDLYHRSLAHLLATSQRFGRYDPIRGIAVVGPRGAECIKPSFHGFVWKPEDFNRLVVNGEYDTSKVKHVYRCSGVGVPLLVIRERNYDEPFFNRSHPFPGTAVLNVKCEGGNSQPVLDFYAPGTSSMAELMGQRYSVASDYSALYVKLLEKGNRTFLEGFLNPGSSDDPAKLVMVEPYQRGKIPIILIHGLLSDPLTWIDVANELNADPTIRSRYQIWAFRYPTGSPFLGAAADLREKIETAARTYDPQGTDPALNHIVLIGHSMGGLVAKLQATSSENLLWRTAARCPLQSIRATAEQRELLARTFFFKPEPRVERVIFIGTPHGGASLASRPIGRIGSKLVEAGARRDETHKELVTNNPDIFIEELQDHIPTSVDMLEPKSKILAVMRQLPQGKRVHFHSIIGVEKETGDEGMGDGIVSAASAIFPGAESELRVDASHEELHHHDRSIHEIACILKRHLSETAAACSDCTTVSRPLVKVEK